jgi:hypothetical protein
MTLEVKYYFVMHVYRAEMAEEWVMDLRQLKALVTVVETGSVSPR